MGEGGTFRHVGEDTAGMKCIDLDIVAETFCVQSELDTPRQPDHGAFAHAVG